MRIINNLAFYLPTFSDLHAIEWISAFVFLFQADDFNISRETWASLLSFEQQSYNSDIRFISFLREEFFYSN